MARSAVSAGARSTFGCVPTAPHGAGGNHRCRRHPAADSRRWPTTPTPRSVRTVCTRVRGTGRGFGAQDGVATPVQWGKTPDRAPNPRPEGHDGRLSEEASPGLTHGLTRVTPRPRTCGRAPGLRTCPRGASATPRHVHNPQTRPQQGESRAPTIATPGSLAPRAARVGSGGVGGAHMAPDFITPILALSQRKPAVRPTRCVRGPRCPISESRRGFALPLQRKPSVRPTRNVRG